MDTEERYSKLNSLKLDYFWKASLKDLGTSFTSIESTWNYYGSKNSSRREMPKDGLSYFFLTDE